MLLGRVGCLLPAPIVPIPHPKPPSDPDQPPNSPISAHYLLGHWVYLPESHITKRILQDILNGKWSIPLPLHPIIPILF